MEEELGINAEIGKLLYVNSFIDKSVPKHSVEFFFEILNAEDYVDIDKIKNMQRSHGFEIDDMAWFDKGSDINLLPDYIFADFQNGKFDKENIAKWEVQMIHSER
jgi:ADP-ribose pyrophosphatase YjhB (NUDIX family)